MVLIYLINILNKLFFLKTNIIMKIINILLIFIFLLLIITLFELYISNIYGIELATKDIKINNKSFYHKYKKSIFYMDKNDIIELDDNNINIKNKIKLENIDNIKDICFIDGSINNTVIGLLDNDKNRIIILEILSNTKKLSLSQAIKIINIPDNKYDNIDYNKNKSAFYVSYNRNLLQVGLDNSIKNVHFIKILLDKKKVNDYDMIYDNKRNKLYILADKYYIIDMFWGRMREIEKKNMDKENINFITLNKAISILE